MSNKDVFFDLLLTVVVRGSGAPIAFFANVLIARNLGPQLFGTYMVMLSSAYLVGGVAVFGADRVMLREIANNWDGANAYKGDVLLVGRWGVLRVLLFSLIGLILILLWFHSPWSNTNSNNITSIFVTSALVPASAFIIITSAFLSGLGNVKVSQSIGDPIRNMFLILGLSGVLVFGATIEIEIVLIIQLFSFLLATMLGWWLIRVHSCAPTLIEYWRYKPNNIAMHKAKMKNFNVSSLHFFLGTAGILVLSRVDILVVNALSNSTEAGYYGAAVRVGQIAALIGLAGSVWLQPKIAKFVQKEEKESLLLTLKQGGLFIGVGSAMLVVLLWVWADFFISLLGPGFEEASVPLCLIGLGYFFWSLAIPLYAFLLMAGSEAIIGRIIWLQVFVNLGLHFMLVPSFGALGAAWAWVAGMLLSSTIITLCGFRKIKFL